MFFLAWTPKSGPPSHILLLGRGGGGVAGSRPHIGGVLRSAGSRRGRSERQASRFVVFLVWTQERRRQVTVLLDTRFGSLAAPQNKSAEADAPRTGVAMRPWNKIPSEVLTGFFKP